MRALQSLATKIVVTWHSALALVSVECCGQANLASIGEKTDIGLDMLNEFWGSLPDMFWHSLASFSESLRNLSISLWTTANSSQGDWFSVHDTWKVLSLHSQKNGPSQSERLDILNFDYVIYVMTRYQPIWWDCDRPESSKVVTW